MGCTCDEHCPESTDCTCIFTVHDQTCNCTCTGPITIRQKPSLYDRVNIDTRGTSLAKLGEFLSNFCDVELFIPAARASEKIYLNMQDATLETVIERVGLVIEAGGGP